MAAYQGSAIATYTAAATASPVLRTGNGRRARPSHASAASAGISEPSGPLVSRASALAANESVSQTARRPLPASPAAPDGSCVEPAARQNAKHDAQTQVENTTSVSISRAVTAKVAPVASTNPASNPGREPNARRPNPQVRKTIRVANNAPGRRAAHSRRPKVVNDADAS